MRLFRPNPENSVIFSFAWLAFAVALSILSYWILVSFLHHHSDPFVLAMFKGTKKIH
jgi:hypothetical protein